MATTIILKDKTELTIDATLKRSVDVNSSVTNHPIESSSLGTITDHVIVEPRKYSLSGLISDVIFLSDKRKNKYTAIVDMLEKAVLSSDLVTIVGKNQIHKNLKLVSFSRSESAGTGNTYDVSINFQEVKFSETKTVLTPKRVIGKSKKNQTDTQGKQQVKKDQDRFTPKKEKGNVPKIPPTEKVKEKAKDQKESIAKGLKDKAIDFVKGFLK
jgi:hypothetical protein